RRNKLVERHAPTTRVQRFIGIRTRRRSGSGSTSFQRRRFRWILGRENGGDIIFQRTACIARSREQSDKRALTSTVPAIHFATASLLTCLKLATIFAQCKSYSGTRTCARR